MNISMKQKQTHRSREQTCSCHGWGWGRDGLGVWDQQMQAIRYKMDKEQGPTESHRKLIKYLVINQNGKKYKKIYIYISESYLQCSRNEHNCKSSKLQ